MKYFFMFSILISSSIFAENTAYIINYDEKEWRITKPPSSFDQYTKKNKPQAPRKTTILKTTQAPLSKVIWLDILGNIIKEKWIQDPRLIRSPLDKDGKHAAILINQTGTFHIKGPNNAKHLLLELTDFQNNTINSYNIAIE